MKKWLILIAIILITITSVNAFSKEKGLDWLNKSVGYDTSTIEESSFSLLALKNNGFIGNNYHGNIIFQKRIDENLGCFPKGSCNVKDTSLGLLARNSFNLDISDTLEWLENSITKANVEDWYLQIQTTGSGKCTIIYDEVQSKIVEVDGTNKLKLENQAGEFDWINLKTHLGVNLDEPIEEVIVDCTKPAETRINDPGMIISLLRITNNNEFYLYEETQGRTVTLEVNNACYSGSQNDACNKEASYYAAWALNKLNKDIIVLPYLEKNAANNKDYAMLLRITGDARYAQLLADNQNTLGYWDNQDIITTSFALNSLKSFSQYNDEYEKARKWLESKQITSDAQNNGSYGNILNTASAMYLAFTDSSFIVPTFGNTGICGDNIIDDGEECDDGNVENGDGCSIICREEISSCIDDNECSIAQFCDNGFCVNKCTSDLTCPSEKPACDLDTGKCKSLNEQCDNDGICELGETEDNCPQDNCGTTLEDECTDNSDCTSSKPICEDGVCVEEEPAQGCTIDDDCEKEGKICNLDTKQCVEKSKFGTVFWASIVILAAFLIIGGYFAYTKLFKKQKPGKPSFLSSSSFEKTEERPRQQQSFNKPSYKKHATDDILERELDKSIKEAERILKK